jgi:uncharacterized C2H2 Zn-finger protein
MLAPIPKRKKNTAFGMSSSGVGKVGFTKVGLICDRCGIFFSRKKSARHSDNDYCGSECAQKARIGKDIRGKSKKLVKEAPDLLMRSMDSQYAEEIVDRLVRPKQQKMEQRK